MLLMEDVVYAKCGRSDIAALKADNSVWTWGYNYSGNCGVESMPEISTPQKVAENVVMVWTGNIDGNVDCKNISDFEGEYPRDMENTIIQKNDGSYWICGANVGDTEHIIPQYYQNSNYEMVCSYQFVPCDAP